MLSGVKVIPRDQVNKEQDKKKDARKKNNEKSRRKRKRSSRHDSNSEDDLDRIEKRSRRNKKWYSSDEYSSESASGSDEGQRGRKKRKVAGVDLSDESEGDQSTSQIDIARKEMGLDWMLRPAERSQKRSPMISNQQEETPDEEIKVNPRELNPYLRDKGNGYPDDVNGEPTFGDNLYSNSLVGDGGASWRRKSLKRLEEQAAREGRHVEEVMEERGVDAGDLTSSISSYKPAHPRAHLHAIKNRRKGQTEDMQTMSDGKSERNVEKSTAREYLKDVSVRNPKMRTPEVHNSLYWRKQKNRNVSTVDASTIPAATSNLNKLADGGNSVGKVHNSSGSAVSGVNQGGIMEPKVCSSETKPVVKEFLSANQLAAKAWQLRKKGNHEEAEKLIQEAEMVKGKQDAGEHSIRQPIVKNTVRHAIQGMSARRDEEDGDRHLAKKIMKNKLYSLSSQADDEYDFEDGPSKKSRKKGVESDHKVSEKTNLAKHFLTQQERCIFCFENSSRPKHLVVSIGNFSYLMLPQWQPVVPGHCCIVPLQHDSASRNVDNNVWEEIRNFKKCLIMMFSKQEKDLVFLETVMGLAQQRRHCLIECIPLPREIAKDAPLYFKKAIDEAEDEWSQHNAKKLIDTSEKGLRGSIPKNFPYFHVEFGLNKGFVHVIDDEKQFNSNLGLNVIRGMLQLPEEDMYCHRKHESVEAQRQAVANFSRDWEPYDWTKQLD